MMDMLSGVLTGSAFGPRVTGAYQTEHRSGAGRRGAGRRGGRGAGRGGAGRLMIAIDIAQIQPLAEFDTRMDQLIADLKAVPLAQGFEEVFYPGEIEALNDARNRAVGLALPDDTLADLRRLPAKIAITPGW